MPFDFDKIIDRHHTGSLKWDVKEGELPLTVADMDFETCPAIKNAIVNRAKSGIYGYTEPTKDWYEAYRSFYSRRHNFEIEKDWLLFSLGVVPTISSSVRKLTSVGDNVVVTPPVYNIFYNSIINNNRVPLEVPLIEKDGNYNLDFLSLEKAFEQEKTTLFILCNPENPVGKIWSKEELARIGELAKKHHVIVLSDEIHGEITRIGTSYVPFLSVNDINKEVGFAAISVTKAFNLAGIQTSAIIVPNEKLRYMVNRQINTDEVAEGNVFSYLAATTALNEGEAWLDELRAYLFSNRNEAESFVENNIPSLSIVKADATYLLWIDARKVSKDSDELVAFIREKTGLVLSSGKVYGKTGNGFLRMNLAYPRSVLRDALKRLKAGIEAYLANK